MEGSAVVEGCVAEIDAAGAVAAVIVDSVAAVVVIDG